ncbi:MAG: DUF2806 domain-containing protein, partial [Planctomycetales bacterium]
NVSDDDVSDESVDDDWLNRWRENAQDVSVEQIQAVWGRILTEEVKSPGSYSIGTLEFLRTISKNEALKIAEIGPYVLFNGTFVFRDKPFLESREISFSKLLDLQELGILSGADAVGLSWSLNSAVEDVFSNAIVAYGKVLVVDREAREPPMTLPVYRITKRGREILGLGNVMPDEEYIKHVGAQIKSLGFRVHYGDLVRNQETGAGVENAVEL